MGSLLNEWIQLFDEKNFQNLKNEHPSVRTLAMLFGTIQNEFRKVEMALNDKIQTYKIAVGAENFMNVKEEPTKDEKISPEQTIKSTSNKMNKTNKILLKSPIFDRHRKANLKKIKKPTNLFMSGVFPLKNKEILCTPKKNNQFNKVIVHASDDEDIFDSSVIGATPNTEVSKTSRSVFNSQRKKPLSKTTTGKTTLTQMFSGMISNEEKRDETSMMNIDEILETVENSDKNDESLNPFNKPESFATKSKISNSFIEDYDKLPVSKNKSTNKFAYKETVRGNEKKKLKGWACKDCENFYKGMNLSDKELEKKMDECSKHKSKFKPDEETIPGYWNMSIPSTPEDEKSPPGSPQNSDSSFNESTVFCFYKK